MGLFFLIFETDVDYYSIRFTGGGGFFEISMILAIRNCIRPVRCGMNEKYNNGRIVLILIIAV